MKRPISGDDAVSAARLRVLRVVSSSARGATIDEVVHVLGGHRNTVRKHVDALCEDGLLERQLAPALGRGRPAHEYLIAPAGREALARSTRGQGWEGMATAFVSYLAQQPDPEETARQVGRTWAANLPKPTADTATSATRELLERQGFNPTEGDEPEIVLRTCPLIDLAKEHPEVVCQIHHGMLSAVAEKVGPHPAQITLLPLTAQGCIVTVTDHED